MSISAAIAPTAPDAHGGMDVARLDFPTLGAEEVYLDSAATSLTPRCVIDALAEHYLKHRANVHRGRYRSSRMASARYEQSLERVAAFFGARTDELVLTMNATHALNLVALSIPFRAGDEIIVPTLEHASNMMPWVRVAKTTGARIQWWNPDQKGRLRLDELNRLISERTRLVAVGHVSNVLGTVAPVSEIRDLCRQRGILFVLDACQSAPHKALDFHALGCDFMVVSAHKMLGPTGIGGLFVREGLGTTIEPAIIGSESVSDDSCPGMGACAVGQMPAVKWVTAGTPPIAETIAWARALDYLEDLKLERIAAHERKLLGICLEGLRGVDGITLFGPDGLDHRTSILAFNLRGVPNEEVGRILSENYRISVRAGTHCARGYFMENQQDVEVYGNVRASFYLYNTEQDAKALVVALREMSAALADASS